MWTKVEGDGHQLPDERVGCLRKSDLGWCANHHQQPGKHHNKRKSLHSLPPQLLVMDPGPSTHAAHRGLLDHRRQGISKPAKIGRGQLFGKVMLKLTMYCCPLKVSL